MIVTAHLPLLLISVFVPLGTFFTYVAFVNPRDWCHKINLSSVDYAIFDLSPYFFVIVSSVFAICMAYLSFFRSNNSIDNFIVILYGFLLNVCVYAIVYYNYGLISEKGQGFDTISRIPLEYLYFSFQESFIALEVEELIPCDGLSYFINAQKISSVFISVFFVIALSRFKKQIE